MRRRHSALSALILTVAAGALAGTGTAIADPAYNARINQGNVPATAAGYSQDCNSDEFGSKQPSQDGWLFVASPSNFTAFEATFNQGTVVLGGNNNPSGTSLYFTKPDEHLAVLTPAGWTLTDAYANLDGNKTFFTLSHTCAASQSGEQAQSTQSTPPSATISGGCDDAAVDMSAGSSDATFSIVRAGDNSTENVTVAAGSSVRRSVSLDQSHPSVSVSANGQTLDSFTRSCSASDNGDNGQNGAGGPNNGAGNGNGSNNNTGQQNGAGNNQGDQGPAASNGSAAHGSTPSNGTPSTDSPSNVAPNTTVAGSLTTGAIAAGQSTSNTPSGVGSGALAGGASPSQQGTQVLGEKLTKSAPATETSAGEAVSTAGSLTSGATSLPFTGLIAAHLLQGAGALLAGGLLLMLLARRRRRI